MNFDDVSLQISIVVCILLGACGTTGQQRGGLPKRLEEFKGLSESINEFRSTTYHRAYALATTADGSWAAHYFSGYYSAEKAVADAIASCRANAAKYKVEPGACQLHILDETNIDGPQDLERALKVSFAELGGAVDDPARAPSIARVQALISANQYGDAVALGRQLLENSQRTAGPDSPEVADATLVLSRAYNGSGNFGEAEQLLRRVLPIAEEYTEAGAKFAAAEHLKVLGFSVEAQGRYAEAEQIYRNAEASADATLGPDDYRIGRALIGLGSVLRSQGKLIEAEVVSRKYIEKQEKEGDSGLVGQGLVNLANIVSDQHRYAEAEAIERRSLDILEKEYGPDDPVIANVLGNLGNNVASQGRYSEAEALLKRSLAIREKVLGSDHPDVAWSFIGLSHTLQSAGRHGEAEQAAQRALSIREKWLGPDHPLVAQSLRLLARPALDQGRYAHSEELYHRALTADEKALGPNGSGVLSDLHGLAEVYERMDRHPEAMSAARRAAKVQTVGSYTEVETEFEREGLIRIGWHLASAQPLQRNELTNDTMRPSC